MFEKLMALASCVGILAGGFGGAANAAPPAKGGVSLYSPAAPSNLMYDYNVEVGQVLDRCKRVRSVEVVPGALPDYLNVLGEYEAPAKSRHLPIVTTVDFLPAITGSGPDWHKYDIPHTDLKFVSSLYDVGFGVLLFDETISTPDDLIGKRIAVPKRPSSLRVLVEALLRDGWGILDQVHLIDLPPQAVVEAAQRGEIDATAWNMMLETSNGHRPLLPPLLEMGQWLEVSESEVNAINASNDFRLGITQVTRYTHTPSPEAPPAPVQLLSFKQALAAWDSTNAATVNSILDCLATRGRRVDSLPDRVQEMAEWPGLEPSLIHPAAIRFYHRHGIKF